MPVECAFGLLKGRWRILNAKIDNKQIERVSVYAYACCILHNICVERGDDLPVRKRKERVEVSPSREVNVDAADLRDTLADFLWAWHGNH